MSKIYTIVFFISITLMLSAVVALFIWGLDLGVDFRGGSIVELQFSQEIPARADIQSYLSETYPEREFSVNVASNGGVILRTGEMTEKDHQDLLTGFKDKFKSSTVEEQSFASVGPVIGKELEGKSSKAIVIALLVITTYIAFVFRKMSSVLSSWAMSIAAMLALAHDIVIPIGAFAVLGHFFNIEISAVFVAALLTILGYSVSDTVVIFDRVRENVLKNRSKEAFDVIVHRSIMQTLTRSLNTTFTTLLSLIAIYFFGGESLKYFALALIMGIFLGAYSSIFVASPILVRWSQWTKKNK